jgi:hypothetical protein
MKLILIMTLCYKSSKYSNANANSKYSFYIRIRWHPDSYLSVSHPNPFLSGGEEANLGTWRRLLSAVVGFNHYWWTLPGPYVTIDDCYVPDHWGSPNARNNHSFYILGLRVKKLSSTMQFSTIVCYDPLVSLTNCLGLREDLVS